jgi:Xaa-Pro aminopeptidase
MSERADRLLALLPDAGIDVLLVGSLANVRYLTGYTGSNGLALVGPGTRVFLTDFRYVTQAAAEVDAAFERPRCERDLLDSVGAALPPGPVRLGFDDRHMSVSEHARLRELLQEQVDLVAAGGLVERLRAVKEPAEVELIQGAAQLADAALSHVIADGLAGRTEREVALALDIEMRRLGSARSAFEPIVAGGPHGALPHAAPRDVPIGTGELVVIDWGAELDGYCSDCTRTVATGDVGDDARAVYELVRSAQQAGLDAVGAGESGREIDGVVRSLIDAAGHGPEFGHGLGHGVGLEVHEAPRLSWRWDDALEAGNVVTVEPGVYVEGRFGVRIEDLVVVTDGGCEVLTGLPKELLLVG